jgi:molecular chaperone GrpE
MADDLQPEEFPDETGEEAAPATDAAPPLDLPEDPAEAVPVLADALMESRSALESRTDDLQRVAAEFENFRKRAARDREEVVSRSSQRLVEALLPVLDSFASAFAHEAKTPGEEAMLGGMRSTYQQLLDVLEKEGLEIIASVGEPFDPAVHEAVMGGGDGHLVVSAEMRRGYALRGRVLRPAMVGVEDEPSSEG